MVALSCALRAAGERRADRSPAALRELVAGTATVLRRTDDTAAPRAHEVPVADLVPGDVVPLGPGDLVPADVRLLRPPVTVSESALTGESAPVAKAAADLPEPLAGLGMTALPAPYHLLLAAVLGLCALALAVATTRHARGRP